ncbi:MAG: methionyl-tRNA formyltransferase, partial [Candidatus Portnoybacteria bacterium]|nr:methionyl-tRNA formyltransferase [Candidatus Portnoybacteria bacterium]
MNKVKTILMGTPDFARRIFEKSIPVLRDVLEIKGVFTSVDKRVGRKNEIVFSPVKKWALDSEFEIFQPEKINNPQWIEKINEINPSLILLCAYGQIIPQEILDIPDLGPLNIHPSLLPKYRGPSPIHAAILNGDNKTGVSLMVMDKEMDHGPVIVSSELDIPSG